LTELVLLDAFDLESFVFETLTHHAALLEEVQALLLLDFRIRVDLVSDSVGMSTKCSMLVFLNPSVVLFRSLLLFNDSQEGITFSLGLLCHHDLPLKELLLSGDFELFSSAQLLFMVGNLLGTSRTFPFLKGALGSKCIDLSLTIGSLLLQFSQASNFLLFLLLDAALFGKTNLELGIFLGVVADNLVVFITLSLSSLCLLAKGSGVGELNLGDHLLVSVLLLIGKFHVSLLHGLNLSHNLLLLFFKKLTFPNSSLLAFLNLVDDDSGATTLGISTDLCFLFGSLQVFQSLDFHHQVEAFLLMEPVFLETLVLSQLLVSDSNDFGVKHHLVHVLDIVVFLVLLLLGLREQAHVSGLLFGFKLTRRQLLCSLFVKSNHTGLASSGVGKLLFTLLAHNFLGLQLVLLGFNLGGSLDSVELRVAQNSSFSSGSFLGLSTELSQLVVGHNSDVVVDGFAVFVC